MSKNPEKDGKYGQTWDSISSVNFSGRKKESVHRINYFQMRFIENKEQCTPIHMSTKAKWWHFNIMALFVGDVCVNSNCCNCFVLVAWIRRTSSSSEKKWYLHIEKCCYGLEHWLLIFFLYSCLLTTYIHKSMVWLLDRNKKTGTYQYIGAGGRVALKKTVGKIHTMKIANLYSFVI